MNRTILIVIIFGALCFGLLFYVFYSELSKTSQSIEIKKQTTDPGYQQQQRPLNNLDVELLNQDIENAKVIYNKPYPFSWEQDGVQINVKGIYHGMIEAPRGISREDGKGNYVGGEKVHALLFNLQVVSPDSAVGKCVKIPARLIDINDQILETANTHQFYFPGSGGCGIEPNMIYEDQQVIFIVQPSTTQFAFLPLGSSEKIFHVMVQGKFMQVEEAVSLEEIGIFDKEILQIFRPKQGQQAIDKDAAPYLKITNPSTTVRIPRGETINIKWDAYNVDASSKVIVRLQSDDVDYLPTKVYKAADRQGGITATMPSGEYLLEAIYEEKVIYSGMVEVIGGNEAVSKRQSEFSFVDRDEISELGTTGENTARVLVRLIDNYNYPISGKLVKLASSRKDDEIVATSERTNKNGEVQFIVTSNEKGISRLTLDVDGEKWEESLLLNVIEGERECGCDQCDCEQCMEAEAAEE